MQNFKFLFYINVQHKSKKELKEKKKNYKTKEKVFHFKFHHSDNFEFFSFPA